MRDYFDYFDYEDPDWSSQDYLEEQWMAGYTFAEHQYVLAPEPVWIGCEENPDWWEIDLPF
jgi:hypothetical protein